MTLIRKIMTNVRGALMLIALAINVTICALLLLLSAIFVYIVPHRRWRHHGNAFLQKFPVWWMDVNSVILDWSSKGKWDVAGEGALKPKGWYMMISNHRSWLDILVVNRVFHRKVPLLKFFMKKELLWSLPVAGLACYVLGFPFLARHSSKEIKKNPKLRGKDLETTRKACEKFKEHPSTVINFVEGTRFTIAKHQKQSSPYQQLLKPRAGGVGTVIQALQHQIDGIIDVTLYYQADHQITFWDFLCGRFDKIIVRYEVLPLVPELVGDYYEDREFRASFQQWLNQRWQQKDQLLSKIKEPTR